MWKVRATTHRGPAYKPHPRCYVPRIPRPHRPGNPHAVSTVSPCPLSTIQPQLWTAVDIGDCSADPASAE